LSKNEKEYVAPHPESAKVVPASEAVTERAKGKKQGVSGVRVRGEVADENIDKVEETLNKVHLSDDLPNGTTA
jgi:CTP synthase